MSEDKVYLVKAGIVQAFMKDGVKQPAVTMGSHNGDTVYNVTIQTPQQNYIDVAMWGADFGIAPSKIVEGTVLWVKGTYTVREGQNGKKFHKINAFTVAGTQPMVKLERTPVNQQAPVAVAAPAAPAAVDPAYQAFLDAQAAAAAAAGTPVAAAPVAAPAAPADNYDF